MKAGSEAGVGEDADAVAYLGTFYLEVGMNGKGHFRGYPNMEPL